MSPRREVQRPTPAQIAAADPSVSAWVGANAGSGKTRVLTQRVARLLLAGSAPERILCLTYTRAAAAEMQNRLFAMLGGWAMAPDAWLGAELAAIAGAEEPVTDVEALARARRLFARALETPGGLKIQTIHAFCDSLLRRFPLEAGVSPRFEVLDERQRALMIAAIRAGMAADAEAGDETSFDGVAERLNEDAIDGLIGAVLGGRAEFPDDDGAGGIDDRLAAHFGAVVGEAAETLAATALGRVDWDRLAVLAEWLAWDGGAGDQATAAAIGEVLALRQAAPLAAARRLAAAFTTKAGGPRSRRGFPVRRVIEVYPDADPFTDDMIAWAGDFLSLLRTRESAARARDLDAFANTLLARYRRAKEARALLDFDDLVSRAGDLLTRSDMAAWALYRLDRGIDHILVDEAQDTAPGQWAVIRAIAHEFHTGAGAREVNRTLFVVGDEKQSIYSFQGAEPQAFGDNRAHFGGWLEEMGGRLARPDLVTSFRSAPGILAYVDAVFDGEAAAGLTLDDDPVIHQAHRVRDASRVDLWPLVEPDPAEDPPPWWTPVDTPPPGNAKLRLARLLAGEIERMIAEDRLPAREGRPGRRVRPGDILVLVTRRDALARGLIRELKGRGLAVAGSDRLSLAEELAVKDLLALVKVATTPGDDLSLAALLRSPLCEVSEDGLFALAHGREGSLWRAVMAAEVRHGQTAAMLRDMAGRADYLRPYEFLERVLIRHDGRRRLLARLGREAEDPIDELLAQALAYEASEAPSLAGFVAWIEAGEIKVKREMERGTDEIRVMTVHGAKGLEAPVVILPDTMSKGGGGGGPVLLPAGRGANQPPLMLWAAAKPEDDPVTRTARAEAEASDAAERKRLLYVALTRAEDWLILCGAGRESAKPGTWYEALEAGMGGASEAPGPEGLAAPVRRRDHNPVPVSGKAEDETPSAPATTPARPGWLAPAPREERAKRLSPSDLGEHVEEGGAGHGRELALSRGSAVHLLLEKLAERPAAEREALAGRLLAHEFPGLGRETASGVAAEALAVFDAPFAPTIFGPDSLAEAGMTLDLPALSARPMLGRIDRLVIGPARVLVVDFKTDARPPASARETPESYLLQLGCYRAALAALYPERTVEAAILWTIGPALMPLDAEILDRALAKFAARAS
ncbi:MAG: double-strand break repair helicase AddA [Proteobacteria bacterium]|nr:double-strand break repair helicase AddA [Pseudomonadota bacterium]